MPLSFLFYILKIKQKASKIHKTVNTYVNDFLKNGNNGFLADPLRHASVGKCNSLSIIVPGSITFVSTGIKVK
jgi:hypothetical protein